MKRFFTGLIVAAAASATLAGCNGKFKTYDGPSYVMFSDTLSIYPVQISGEAFEVPIVATQTSDRDRTFGVEVIYRGSSALYNYHYTLESGTVVIKAGQRTAPVRVLGNYNNIENDDTLEFRLRLVSLDDIEWDMYGMETKVSMFKSCPFDINNFTGYCLLTSTFLSTSTTNAGMRLITSELAEGEENTVLLKNFYTDGYDVKVKFDPSDLVKPRFRLVGDPAVADTRDIFNWIYGDGLARAVEYRGIDSYFNTCHAYAVLYLTVYVENVGTVDVYGNILEWLSDAEARDYM